MKFLYVKLAIITLLAVIGIAAVTFVPIQNTQVQAAGITIPASGSINHTGTLNIPGYMVNQGILQVSTGTITLTGDWTNSGTFSPDNGTVEFTGTSNQAINGSSTFYNLTCTTAGGQLTFEAGMSQTVTSALTLTGTSGNPLKLRSSVDGTQWKIDPQGTKNISWVDVKDSNNINGTLINPTDWTDSGNNSNWVSTGGGDGGGGGGGGGGGDTLTITSVSPSNGATNVAINTMVSATFSLIMNGATLNTNTFTLSGGGSEVSGVVTTSGNTATFTPTGNLAYNTTYTATITTGAQAANAASTALSSNYTWSFTTIVSDGGGGDGTPTSTSTPTPTPTPTQTVIATPTPIPSTTPSDTTAPFVLTTSPANEATGVLTNSSITATFSEAMDVSTIGTSTFILSGGISGSVTTVTGTTTTAMFTPSGNLNYSTTYTASVTTGVRDLSDNAMTSPYTWSFRTVTSLPPTVATKPATNVNSHSAILNGTVNANGLATTAWFEYGTSSTSLTGISSTQTINGTDDTEISIGINGLSPNTAYYYRAAAQNPAGTSYGNQETFTTLQEPSTITADFTAYPTTGEVPLTVHFTDLSSGDITSWYWDCGDGTIGSIHYTKDATHVFTFSGTFTVSHTVSGPTGTSTKVMENYITVYEKSSQIGLQVSSPEITFGESLTVTGQISPAHEAPVTLTFTHNNDETDTETVTSGADGAFTLADYFPPAGGSWSVVASWEGDSDHSGAASNPVAFSVNKAKATLTIASSSDRIQIDQTVEITGDITLTPDNVTTQNKFMEERLKLFRIDPDEEYEDVPETQPFLSDNQLHYEFGSTKLPETGTWTVSAGFESSESFEGAHSENVSVEVQGVSGDTAGYAILAEGRNKDKSDLASHNLTTNYIYKKLLERGFKAEDVYYFNYDGTEDGVDGRPSSDKVLNAISDMAGKMNASPAPFYIILVGNGDKDKFFVHPDKLKADALAKSINNLQSQLNSDASKEAIIVILGANYSGSFIDDLAITGNSATPEESEDITNKPMANGTSTSGIKKHIVITSSDTDELAFQGPLPPDETNRHEDYFTYNFFKYAGRGMSLKKSYELAVNEIATFTGNGQEDTDTNKYFDRIAQHPLLDDNGDGAGTFKALSSISGRDGVLSSDIFLGFGTITPALEFTDGAYAVIQDTGEPTPSLFARVNNTTLVDRVWVEIVSPDFKLKGNKDHTEQRIMDLPRFTYNAVGTNTPSMYLWNNFSSNEDFNNFAEPGDYQIFYFAKDKLGDLAPLMNGHVYINKTGNQPPNSFTYLSPANGTETTVALTFDWEDSEGATSYNFMISDNSDFDPIYYQELGLTDSIAIVDKTANLQDGVTYYWKVMSLDNDGGVTFIETNNGTSSATAAQWQTGVYNSYKQMETTGTSIGFTPKLANGYPGFIQGVIYDKDTNALLSNATVSAEGTNVSFTTTENGAYILQLSSGTYTVSARATGYATSAKNVHVDALNTAVENFGLFVPAVIFGKVKNETTRKPIEGVTITARKKKSDFITTTTTDDAGNYSINDLESGKYKVRAKKKGYTSYRSARIKLHPGKHKKLNIRMNR